MTSRNPKSLLYRSFPEYKKEGQSIDFRLLSRPFAIAIKMTDTYMFTPPALFYIAFQILL